MDLTTAFQEAPAALLVVDAHRVVRAANAAACHALQLSTDGLVGQRLPPLPGPGRAGRDGEHEIRWALGRTTPRRLAVRASSPGPDGSRVLSLRAIRFQHPVGTPAGSLRERARLATELHDRVLPEAFALATGAAALAALARTDRCGRPGEAARTTDVAGTAEELAERARSVLVELRRVVEGRTAATLPAPGGLVAAVRALAADTAGRTGLRVDVRVDTPGDGDLLGTDADGERAGDVYRVVAEALHNAVKHATASVITVHLAVGATSSGTHGTAPRWLTVEISDDGVGSTATPAAGHGAGLGLPTMRARARRWRGTLSTGPAPGGGTRVTLRLPLTASPSDARRLRRRSPAPLPDPGIQQEDEPQQGNGDRTHPLGRAVGQ